MIARATPHDKCGFIKEGIDREDVFNNGLRRKIKDMINRQMMDKIRINIDNYFNELTGNEKFSGVILVSIKGEKVVSKGYGMANYELDIPNKSRRYIR